MGDELHAPESARPPAVTQDQPIPPARQLPERTSASAGRRTKAWEVLLPLGLLALGAGFVWFMMSTRTAPKRHDPGELSERVKTVTVHPQSVEFRVRARGRVEAARKARLSALVPGPVTWVSEQLTPGGRFKRGEVLLRVDPSEYRLAVRTRRGEVSRASLELDQEQSRRFVRQEAWDLYSQRRLAPGAPATPLALNLPQMAAAEQSLKAAESQLEQAELNLSRTRLIAPFDAIVETEKVDLGQRVSPNQDLMTLVGIDHYRVRSTIDVADVRLIEIPGVDGAKQGSPATIRYSSQGHSSQCRGEVVHLQAGLDDRGMMARIIVRVDDPLGDHLDAPGPPLLLGARGAGHRER